MRESEFTAFTRLTGFPPLPWQQVLFDRLSADDIPLACDIPTGLGKTSILAVWLLAFARQAAAGKVTLPRRLAYVVNRRTVVDQATREAERLRAALISSIDLGPVTAALRSVCCVDGQAPLAISTLRGEFADNAEWRHDPARPAIIVGTVDMIGSRLLFGGYGCGFRSKPLHAGFLGQDTLVVHDEAHLEPAFQELLCAIQREQDERRDFRRLRVMALTATSRGSDSSDVLRLSNADLRNDVVCRRIDARKGLLLASAHEKALVEVVIECALAHKDGGGAILVFLRSVDHVEKVAEAIRRDCPVVTLTGTMRGLEREALTSTNRVFARFMPAPSPKIIPMAGTVYLVCTSAGEVGVNISADHLVCDLTPFDSMAQRFGRVNRFGEGDARIDVVYHAGGSGSEDFERARERTVAVLSQLPVRDDGSREASPRALSQLDPEQRQAAFTPAPEIVAVTDVLFDNWSLTTVRGKVPGRPPLVSWLHGVAAWEPPETYVAWRAEVEHVTGSLLEMYEPSSLLEDFPLKPHELLHDRTDRVLRHITRLAAVQGEAPVWILESDGAVTVSTLAALAAMDKAALSDRTVILSPSVGGLRFSGDECTGMLDGAAAPGEHARDLYDVADRRAGQAQVSLRCRIWDEMPVPEGMRLVRSLDVRPTAEEEGEADGESARVWRWYVRPRAADDDGSRTAMEKQLLGPHLELAEQLAVTLIARLGLEGVVAEGVRHAAAWHDAGKRRAIWQQSVGNSSYPDEVWAKSGRNRMVEYSHYRHEFGSMLEAADALQFRDMDTEARDLAMHLIAAHHGRARPHFPADEVFDPDRSDSHISALGREVPRRFARLQRRYGRWGIAYLESLLRAADALASDMGGSTR